jgi:hypothetical protein
MKKYGLALLLGLWGTSLFATPLSFTSSQYQTDASALVGNTTDSNSDTSPPLFLQVSATAGFPNSDFASSDGTAEETPDYRFLGTAIDVTGVTEEASGAGNAEFRGEFIAPGGPILISIQFNSQSDISEDGTAEGQLSLSLISNGIPLPVETFTVSGIIERGVNLPAGAAGELDLFLTSTATATDGIAFNQATATFDVSVPEAPTLLIFLLGLALMIVLGRHRSELFVVRHGALAPQ